jgi:hypothetical protein
LISLIPHLLAAVVMLHPNPSPDVPTFQVICEGVLPFSRAELETALRPRWRLLGRPLERPVLVRQLSDGSLSIEVGSSKVEIGLQDQTGEAAARIVALLAVDLLAESAAADGGRDQKKLPARGFTVSAQLLIPFVAGRSPSLEPTVDLGVRVLSFASVGLSLGYTSLSAGSGPTRLDVREFPLRAGVGYVGHWLDVRACAVMRPYFVAGAGQDRGVHWGASVSATAYHQLTTWLAIAVSVGVDGLRKRTDFRVDNQSVLSTNWLVPWFGAGIALRRAP